MMPRYGGIGYIRYSSRCLSYMHVGDLRNSSPATSQRKLPIGLAESALARICVCAWKCYFAFSINRYRLARASLLRTSLSSFFTFAFQESNFFSLCRSCLRLSQVFLVLTCIFPLLGSVFWGALSCIRCIAEP